jgi:hypothetical protein
VAAIGAAAIATEKIRPSGFVFSNALRHPDLLATAAA